MQRFIRPALIAAALAVAPTAASADVLVSEFFANLNGSEGTGTEWIEIYNNDAAPVDISGWTVGDSQDANFYDPFAAGTTLAGNSALVVTAQSTANFQSIWGNVPVVTSAVGAVSLSNSPSDTNETVAIVDAGGNTVDEVNFDDDGVIWPDDTPEGFSIYLLPAALDATANDVGTNWARSAIDVDGGYQALIPNPDIANAGENLDVASPGIVASSVVPEPTSMALLGLGSLAALRRRVRRA